jgi:hypothetical protein
MRTTVHGKPAAPVLAALLLAALTFALTQTVIAPVLPAEAVVVNEAFVARYFPGEDPVGQRLGFGAEDEWWEIVGVVGDVPQYGLDRAVRAQVYLPHEQFSTRSLFMIVRAAGETHNTPAGCTVASVITGSRPSRSRPCRRSPPGRYRCWSSRGGSRR